MSDVRNKPVDAEPRPSSDAGEGSPLRVFVLGAIVIIVVVAALLTVIRLFLFPVWEANSEGAHQVATAQVQLSAAMTQEALTPMPTSTLTVAAATQPTTASTPVPTDTPAVASQATAVATALATSNETPVSAAPPGSLPTPTADQAAEIASAYEQYFNVTSDALLNLDPSRLGDVAADQELAALQQNIQQDRAEGRALDTNVEHDFYVIGYAGDKAQVADRYKDSSIYVDPVTHAALPGQVTPASPEVAPAVSVIYQLQRIDGTWKVVSGQRYLPHGSQ
jgi:hypothetical protein